MPDPGTTGAAPPPLVEGRPIPGTPYRVLRRLRGSPQRALVEHDAHSGRFTLEILPAAASRFDMPRRLINEWRRLGALGHRGIARISDAGAAAGGLWFCVLADVEGPTLAERLAREERLGAGEALGVAASVLSALGAAHAIGVVHGGVRPDNVFLGRGGRIQLAGFGAARLDRAPATLLRAAPEQRAAEPFDRRADMYAVGLLLFEMLTGEPLLDGNITGAALALRLAQRAAGLPPELETLLGELLASDPQARPPSAARAAARLRKIALKLRAESVADDATTRPAGYNAPTVPRARAGARTDVDLCPPWLDAQAEPTRPDGVAVRRGAAAAGVPKTASIVPREPAALREGALERTSGRAALREGALERTALCARALGRASARAAALSPRARVALAASITLACCALLSWPWLGSLRAWTARIAPSVSAASRQTPPPKPARASERRGSETVPAVLVVDRKRSPPHRAPARPRTHAARRPSARRPALRTVRSPCLRTASAWNRRGPELTPSPSLQMAPALDRCEPELAPSPPLPSSGL